MAAIVTPDRSHDQRLAGLERANDVRSRKAQTKRDLKSGAVSIHALLTDPPYWIRTAKVGEILMAVPKVGRVKASKLTTQCRISPSRSIGALSQRQREELISLLRR